MRQRWILALSLVPAAFWGCDGGSSSLECEPGTERCVCYRNGTCNDGLVCLSSRCVDDGKPDGGTAGTAGTGGAAVDAGAPAASTGGAEATGGVEAGGGAPGGGNPGGAGGDAVGGNAGTAGAPSTGGTGGIRPDTGGTSSGGVAAAGGELSGGTGGTGGDATGGVAAGGAGGDASGGTGALGGTPASGGAAGAGGDCVRGAGAGYSFFDDFECGADLWSPSPAAAFSLLTGNTTEYAVTELSASLSYATAGSPLIDDVRIEVDVRATSFGTGSAWSYVAVFGDFVDNRNYRAALWQSDGTLAISERTNGGGSDMYDNETLLTQGEWYTLGLEIEGATTRVYLDGTLLRTATGKKIPSGRIAIGTYNAMGRFDNVRVTLL